MNLFCPRSNCPNHYPDSSTQWFDYHGTYTSCGLTRQRYRCRHCGKTFSERTLSIDYWTHRHIDYDKLIEHFASGYSVRGLGRHFHTNTQTIQNRFSRLARNFIAVHTSLHHTLKLKEHLVADGLEGFCVSQDFPNNIHLLAGKESQFLYGFNYALMRRKGRKTEVQKKRCEKLYPLVDFTSHTIKGTFKELLVQMTNVAHQCESFRFYTDEKEQYRLALNEDPFTCRLAVNDSFSHITISSKAPRTILNDLFSVNYLDREVRKDLPEFHRETVCFSRNVTNSLERLCVYFFHHNFIKRYRIGVPGEERTHAEVAGVERQDVERIREEVITTRSFYHDGSVSYGGFFDELWRRELPTPLKKGRDYLPRYAIA
jgi:transposase-like protein